MDILIVFSFVVFFLWWFGFGFNQIKRGAATTTKLGSPPPETFNYDKKKGQTLKKGIKMKKRLSILITSSGIEVDLFEDGKLIEGWEIDELCLESVIENNHD